MSTKATGDNPICADEECGPAAIASRRVAAADPYVIGCSGRLHGGWHCDFRVGRPPAQPVVLLADLRLHRSELSRRDIAGVKRMKGDLNTLLLVVSIQLGISIVVADQHSTTNATNLEDARMVARGVVSEISRSFGTVARAEALVVAVDDVATIIDDVRAVVRFSPPRESMAGSENHPKLQL